MVGINVDIVMNFYEDKHSIYDNGDLNQLPTISELIPKCIKFGSFTYRQINGLTLMNKLFFIVF